MSKKVHQAFLISLCVHLLVFIFLRILLEKNTVYEDENKATIVADILPPIKPRVIPTIFKLESNNPTEHRKLAKSIKSFLLPHNDILIEQPSFRKEEFSATHLVNTIIEFEYAIIDIADEGLINGTAIRNESISKYTDSMEEGEDTVEQSLENAGEIEHKLLKQLAEDIVEDSDTPIDIIFIVDTSSSMGDNIKIVAEHLAEMINTYEASNIDYALGLVTFRVLPPYKPKYLQKQNRIGIWPVSKDWKRYQKILQGLDTQGWQHAYDAIYEAIFKVRFRPKSRKHFILVTDEPFSSAIGLGFDQVVAVCREFGIKVNVLGINEPQHQLLALKTGGLWRQIP